MELKDKKVLVVGLGKSGVSSARLLQKLGARVQALELKPRDQVPAPVEELEKIGVQVRNGKYGPEDFRSAELVVLSPGVNEQEELFRTLAQKGVEVIGDLELAGRFISAPILAVSGTDGKTTTVSLLGDIFERAYPGRVWVGGNIGRPVADLALSGQKPEIVILEVSSFQLRQAQTFHPKIAVMLNLARDHLDRHQNFEDYYQAKQRLFINQNKKDLAILNLDDPGLKRMEEYVRSKGVGILWFGEEIGTLEGAMISGGKLIYRNSRREFNISYSGWKLLGRHNLENLLAALAAAGTYGVEPGAISEAVNHFSPPRHRLEFVAEVAGVKYYDDSKGTTPHAVAAAVRSFKEPLILLLGGRNKGIDFSELAPELKDRVKTVICFGESRYEIKEQLMRENIRSVLAEKMSDAVLLAKELAHAGEVVLLSPGCASFDEFKDYAERGDRFQELVRSFK